MALQGLRLGFDGVTMCAFQPVKIHGNTPHFEAAKGKYAKYCQRQYLGCLDGHWEGQTLAKY